MEKVEAQSRETKILRRRHFAIFDIRFFYFIIKMLLEDKYLKDIITFVSSRVLRRLLFGDKIFGVFSEIRRGLVWL